MKIKIFFFLLILPYSYAIEINPICGDKTKFKSLEDEVSAIKNYYAFSETNCISKEPPTIEAIDNYFQERYDTSDISEKKILGVTLSGPKKLLEHFYELVSHQVKIPNSCKDVFCAAESIWGETLSKKLLYLKDRYGFNGSELKSNVTIYGQPTRWKEEKLDIALKSIQDLPDFLFPIETDRDFKFHPYYSSRDVSINANSYMYFFGGTFYRRPYRRGQEVDRPEIDTRRIFLHELAHYIADGIYVNGKFVKLDQSKEWLDCSNWESTLREYNKIQWNSPHKESLKVFVTQYASTTPAEDFADSLSYYRYYPEKLKEISECKYNYIKNNVFSGIEYTSFDLCDFDKFLKKKIENELVKPIGLSAIPQKDIFDCYKKVGLESNLDDKLKCLKSKIPDILISQSFESERSEPYKDKLKRELKKKLENSNYEGISLDILSLEKRITEDQKKYLDLKNKYFTKKIESTELATQDMVSCYEKLDSINSSDQKLHDCLANIVLTKRLETTDAKALQDVYSNEYLQELIVSGIDFKKLIENNLKDIKNDIEAIDVSKFDPKPESINECKDALLTILDSLDEDKMGKCLERSVLNFKLDLYFKNNVNLKTKEKMIAMFSDEIKLSEDEKNDVKDILVNSFIKHLTTTLHAEILTFSNKAKPEILCDDITSTFTKKLKVDVSKKQKEIENIINKVCVRLVSKQKNYKEIKFAALEAILYSYLDI